MGALAFLVLIMAILGEGTSTTPSPAQVRDATDDARRKRARARQTGSPEDHHAAHQAEQHAATVHTQAAAARTPPPWPQVVPAGLPQFPGGWVPDQPPGAGVVTRAFQLLSQLWQFGEGTWKTEQTAGRWITYQARMMGDKKGVVAFRPAAGAMAPTAPSAVMPASAPFPAPGPVVPAVHVEPAGAPAAASQPMGADTITRAPSSGHPVLRLQHPNMSGPSVVWVQQKLGVGTDGFFGPATKAAVQAFQSSHGLSPDGVVGPLTWAALGG